MKFRKILKIVYDVAHFLHNLYHYKNKNGEKK